MSETNEMERGTADEVNSAAELAKWCVSGMIPDVNTDPLMAARAKGIARRIESVIRAERACHSDATDRAVFRSDTLTELRQSAIMIRTWIPESFPSTGGQVHFVRAVIETVASVIERALTEYGVDAGLVNAPTNP